MSNDLANYNTSRAAHANLAWRAELRNPGGQDGLTRGYTTAAPAYRISLHRARRARAVLVASAADVIDRAL